MHRTRSDEETKDQCISLYDVQISLEYFIRLVFSETPSHKNYQNTEYYPQVPKI